MGGEIMKLMDFSVTNYRSITTAHKLHLQDMTVLVGKNNEGKSNLLRALYVSMNAVIFHSRFGDQLYSYAPHFSRFYEWNKDFPIQLQNRKSGTESIFRLTFRLEGNELAEFHSTTGTRGNEDIPISVRIGKDGIPKVEVPKKGSPTYNKKSSQITEFISKKISFNYIKAIRTEGMAIGAIQEIISSELGSLENNPEYTKAQETIGKLQKELFDNISSQLLEPMRVFLPSLRNISIVQDYRNPFQRRHLSEIDIVIDDGLATSISNKGDGIKSLVALALLKDKKVNGASVIAIEEPESHLHSGAIHNLVDVINKIAEKNQVIITTHNPLFVQQNIISANIIVDQGTARPAKNVAEIRSILGVLPSDNLRNARFVLVVEGEEDKLILEKILSLKSEILKKALHGNELIIKPLGGASNLSHDLADLKNSMCKFIVLLDNDKAGNEAANKATNSGLLKESELKFTICNGSPEAEIEDCLKPDIYASAIQNEYSVSISVPQFRGSEKWSDRVKTTFLSQGNRWTDQIEMKVKRTVANCVSSFEGELDDLIISQKSSFLSGLTTAVEKMIQG